MFINNINGAINKNWSLFFFPSDIKLAWKAKQKQWELSKNQLFFLFLCCFFLKIQDKGNQKHQFLKGDSIKLFWVKCWPFFKQAAKYYTKRNGFCLKIFFLMILSNFIFVVSYLKKHLSVHLNTSTALTSL